MSPVAGPVAVILSLLLVAMAPQPVAAQGLIESLFGFLGSGNSEKKSTSPVLKTKPEAARRYNNENRSNPFDARAVSRQVRYVGGRYKTLCVRLCDGYFFPISNATRRRNFYDDAQLCQSQCDSETRLFYMSPRGSSIKNAVDQRGLAYDKLKTAFLYRKTLKKECTCRPKPWSVAERMRHQTYALVDQDKLAGASVAGVAQDPDKAELVEPKVAASGDTDGVPTVMAAAPVPREAPPPQSFRRHIAVPRPIAVPVTVKPSIAVRPKPARKKNNQWGLGSAFGNNSGLPPVKYRHRWPGDTD